MNTIITATRYHDIDCGHRVTGHKGKCQHLHGHSYRVHFTIQTQALDELGMTIDFGVIKDRLCNWLEDNWDHRMLLWVHDPILALFHGRSVYDLNNETEVLWASLASSVVAVPFNPTAENMANWLLADLGPRVFHDLEGVRLSKVVIEETRKCSAAAEIGR